MQPGHATHDKQVIVVTGANGNLGRVVCDLLAARGAQVVAMERTRVLLHGTNELLAEVDFRDAEGTRRAFATVRERLGHLHGVVHAIGAFRYSGDLEEAPLEDFSALFSTHALTTVHVLRAAVPLMKREGAGRIVVVAAMASLAGDAGISAYAASKAAELSIVQSAAAELRGSGVCINAVLPGTIDTPQNRASMPDADTSAWVSPSAVADVVATLTSPDLGPVTGQAIRVV